MAEFLPCSLQKVALAAGVAPSTASLALRDSPLVKAATRARVKAAAEQLGYRSDPRVGSLMARIRGAREVPDRERLAFIWLNALRADKRSDRFSNVTFHGARRRAEQLGWVLEEFWLHDAGMTTARLEKILITRGITGVVFSAPLHALEADVDWNWTHFAAAVIGNSEFHPPLHRAGQYHYRNMWIAMEKLREAGCHRPAAVLHEPHHVRVHGVHQAAFVANHPVPQQALGMTRFGLPDTRQKLRDWLKAVNTDSLVFSINPSDDLIAWLRRLPQIKFLVTLDRPQPGLPGIDTLDSLIAASAVDLVLAQLHRNERGVPEHPTSLLLEGKWHEG